MDSTRLAGSSPSCNPSAAAGSDSGPHGGRSQLFTESLRPAACACGIPLRRMAREGLSPLGWNPVPSPFRGTVNERLTPASGDNMIPAVPGRPQLVPRRGVRREMVNDPLTPWSPGVCSPVHIAPSPACGCDSSRSPPKRFRLAALHEFLQNTAMILMIKESLSFLGSRL